MKIATPLLALSALLAASSPVLAAPGEMNVATFVAKADALKAKGAMAMFSSDLSLLTSEGRAAGAAYHARLDAERAAGHPSSCPAKGTKVNSDQLMGFLAKYPAPARAHITMRAAMADYFIHTYPCK